MRAACVAVSCSWWRMHRECTTQSTGIQVSLGSTWAEASHISFCSNTPRRWIHNGASLSGVACGSWQHACNCAMRRMDPAPDFGLHDYEGHGKLKDKVSDTLRLICGAHASCRPCCDPTAISSAATFCLSAPEAAVNAHAASSCRQVARLR